MSDKKAHVQESGDTVQKLEGFWNKYQKQIAIVAGALVAITAGWFAYQSFVVEPKEQQAADAIFKAEANFGKDSVKLALNGDGTSKGFLYIINNYSGTKSANLAKYYAGVCYLRTGDFKNAIKHLEDFSTDAKQIQMMAYGALGDAYGEINKNEEAVSFYKKAAATFEDDEANASEYLFRAGLKLELMGKATEAVEVYKQVKDKFPQTDKGFQAEKYIYRLSIQPNDFSSK